MQNINSNSNKELNSFNILHDKQVGLMKPESTVM